MGTDISHEFISKVAVEQNVEFKEELEVEAKKNTFVNNTKLSKDDKSTFDQSQFSKMFTVFEGKEEEEDSKNSQVEKVVNKREQKKSTMKKKQENFRKEDMESLI